MSRIADVLKRATGKSPLAAETQEESPWDLPDAAWVSDAAPETPALNVQPDVTVADLRPALRPAHAPADREAPSPLDGDLPLAADLPPIEEVPMAPEPPPTPERPPEVVPVVAQPALVTSMSRVDAIEQYRGLAAALHEAQQERSLHSVVCTSAVVGEGKTVTASNLALTLAESYGRRVLLIDADLRRPQLHLTFGFDGTRGLRDVLSAPVDSKLPIHQVGARLSVLPAGAGTIDPLGGLTSERLRRLLEEATARFDWVIFDTPPSLVLPDARVLASMADTCLLVVRVATTPFRKVLRAVELLRKDRIFGVVLNAAGPSALDAEYVGYHGYYAAVGTRGAPPHATGS